MGTVNSKTIKTYIPTRRIDSQALFWTAPMVASWIDLIGLSHYRDAFLENGVDGPTLLELRMDQFERCLGVTNPLHEFSLRCGLQDLKLKMIDYTQWKWSCHGVMEWLALRGLEQLASRFNSAAIHGGVLFRMKKTDFAIRLFVGEQGESELILESLWHSVERARISGFYQEQGNFLDWGPSEVRLWLESIHLAHLSELFRAHAVNGTLLPHLDLDTMRRVMKLSEIQTIVVYKAIRKLMHPPRYRYKPKEKGPSPEHQRLQNDPTKIYSLPRDRDIPFAEQEYAIADQATL